MVARGGANVVTWVTSNTFCSNSNAAFHQNANDVTTGNIKHFPTHLPRKSNPNYLEDMSVWAGDSRGSQLVAGSVR